MNDYMAMKAGEQIEAGLHFKKEITKKLLESYMDGQNDCIDNLILSFKEYPGTYTTFNDLIDQFKKVKENINKVHKGG